jgi:hypothetical protein
MTEAEYVVSIPPWVTKVKIAFAESYPVALKTPVPAIINVGRLEQAGASTRSTEAKFYLIQGIKNSFK